MASDGEMTFTYGGDLDISDKEVVELYAVQRGFGSWTRPIDQSGGSLSPDICKILEIHHPTDTVGRDDIINAVYSEDREMVIEAMRKSVEEKLPFEYTFRVPKPDGSLKLVRTSGECRRTEDGVDVLFGITFTLFPNVRSVGYEDPV